MAADRAGHVAFFLARAINYELHIEASLSLFLDKRRKAGESIARVCQR